MTKPVLEEDANENTELHPPSLLAFHLAHVETMMADCGRFLVYHMYSEIYKV